MKTLKNEDIKLLKQTLGDSVSKHAEEGRMKQNQSGTEHGMKRGMET